MSICSADLYLCHFEIIEAGRRLHSHGRWKEKKTHLVFKLVLLAAIIIFFRNLKVSPFRERIINTFMYNDKLHFSK